MSSAGTTRWALASCATADSPCNTVLLGLGPTTTPSSVAMATRSLVGREPDGRPCNTVLLASSASRHGSALALDGPRGRGREGLVQLVDALQQRRGTRSGGTSPRAASGRAARARARPGRSRCRGRGASSRAPSSCAPGRRARRSPSRAPASARRRARAPPRASRTSAISCDAVLSPIPGTPAMLSEVSPFRPMKSGTLSGGDPEPRLDALGRVDVHVGDAARGHHQADVVGDELERVAVGRDDARPDRRPRRRASRAWRSRRPPPSPRTRGCGSRTPRRSAGSTGTARAADPASAGGPPCTRRRAPRGARAACPRRRRRPSAGSRRAA